MNTCAYCNKIFSDKKSLKIHVTTNKKCNKNRGIILVNKFNCSDCTMTFTRQVYLTEHLKTCVHYQKNIIISELQNTISNLQKDHENEIIKITEEYEWKIIQRDEKIAEKNDKIFEQKMELKNLHDELKLALSRPSTIINNNNIVNDNRKYITKKTVNQYMLEHSEPVTDRLIRDCVKNLSIEHIKDTGRGLARCTLEVIGPRTIITTDVSRKSQQYVTFSGIDNNKVIYKDIALHEFLPKIMSAFEPKVDDLLEKYFIDNFDNHNLADIEKLSCFKNNIKSEALDITTDIRQDYIAEISKHTHKDNVIPLYYLEK